MSAATTPGIPTAIAADRFDEFDRALRERGPASAIESLVDRLDGGDDPRALLDGLLLKARYELGLPLVAIASLAEIAEPARTAYEDRYVEALRRVGRKLLDSGDIAGAWPYFRAVGDREPVVAAIEAYRPEETGAVEDRLSGVIDVAFQQMVHPRRGFELILDHHGACAAITAFDHLPPEESVRVACLERLVKHLHDALVANLRHDIASRGGPGPEPPPDASIGDLVAGREWLFADDAYHLDVSHLSAVVRLAPMLTDPGSLARAVGLADYGRHLSDRHQYPGEPPFESLHDDHLVYLRALLGESPETAIARFRSRLPDRAVASPPELDPDDPFDEPPSYRDKAPAEALVRLLVRLGRFDEAIDVAAEHLAEIPDSALACPSLPRLCAMAGRVDRLVGIARDRDDLVHYAAALLQLPPG